MPVSLTVEGARFTDRHGREIFLRGINLAADTKFPKTPEIPSHVSDKFFDGDNVSFVGRPFSLEDADVHFRRLRNWGYNTLRYLYTWEALEARGPGVYDEEYINFTVEVLRKAKQYGFYVFLDPHQDVWSRFSGGSGAPMWTLYAAGLNPRAFDVTEAALVHNTYRNPVEFPKMIWATNYTRMVCQVMFTLFFAGCDFAPKAIINGQNIQDYLQSHYINASVHLAQRIKEAGDLEDITVIGWESFNEPNHGLVGYQDLTKIPVDQQLQKGTSPTAWQAILTASGRACEIETWELGSMGSYRTGKILVDPKGTSAWLGADYPDTEYGWKRDPGWRLGECIWAQHGVWSPETDELLRPDYFSKTPAGQVIDAGVFCNTYFMDHWKRWAHGVRSMHQNSLLLLQPPVWVIPPVLDEATKGLGRIVYAPHYYDGLTLMSKKWNRFFNVDVLGVLRGRYLSPAFAVKLGETAIRNSMKEQLTAMKQEGLDNIGSTPCLFSEIGIPYDMDDKYAYKTGDYTSQTRASDANHFALEGSLASYTWWNYCALNNHEWGDQWNGEDLSIYGRDDTAPERDDPGRPLLEPYHDSPRDASNTIDSGSIKNTLSNTPMSIERSSTSIGTSTGTRAADAFIRPAPIKISGVTTAYSFNLAQSVFSLAVNAIATAELSPSEIFVPLYHFPKDKLDVVISDGKWAYDTETQILKWWHSGGSQTFKVTGVKRFLQTFEDDTYFDVVKNVGCNII
ncbi:hypothetical protein TWF192_002900 [Orbilia oligospora]|uniref:Uncharacterized protein n=1 Tax=Orbilia oligospora TaxID=2813651 RepID=A0A6G1LRH7_ORBOL|nr:hypothetical protein TWF191_002614 [Orbilia oligospora]KAF3232675.1 hypothetical protein TWF192_002900 [Orbilia oligospora]